MLSGHLESAVEITLCTENGEITKPICIAAKRHIHMSPDDAKRLNVNDGDNVNVELQNARTHPLYLVMLSFGPCPVLS